MLHRIAGTTLAAVLAGPGLAEAHPPYEGKARVLTAPGGDVEVVKSYVDGIFGTDPAKIVVRSHGTVHAETGYHRDTSLACSAARCLIAAADSPFAVVPEQMWVLEGTCLRNLDSFGVGLVGALVHLWDHLVGYGIALFFLLVPIAAIRKGVHIGQRESSAAGCFAMLLAVGALGVLLVWVYVMLVLSELSMTGAVLLGAALLIGGRAVRTWRANALPSTRPAQTTEPRS